MFATDRIRSKLQILITQLRSYPFLHEKENAEFCANILETIWRQSEIYSLLCQTDHYYSAHFLTVLDKKRISEDDVFPLLEDSIMLVREKTLKSGIHRASFFEQKAIEYVLTGALWSETDGTLFSEAFFHQLPLSIIQSISLELTQTLHSTPVKINI